MCNFDLITGAISRSTPKRRLPADVSSIVNSPSTYSTNSTFRGSSTTVLTPDPTTETRKSTSHGENATQDSSSFCYRAE